MRVAALLLLLAPALAGEDEVDEAVQVRLERDGFAIGDRPLRQVFEAYIGRKEPVFVTSDSILNAYHVLFEESVMRLETARAAQLGDAVAFLYRHAPRGLADTEIEPAVREAAVRRLRLVLATALVLLQHDTPDLPPEATDEARRIERGEGMGKPEWLGPPDPGFRAIDYARFRPGGFYTRRPTLQRYFRAVSWLQAIPFRVDRDEELVAVLLLHDLLGGLREGVGFRDLERAKQALGGYDDLLGPGDDVTVLDALGIWTDRLSEMRKHYRNVCHERSKIHDQVAERQEPSIRILGAARTPDALLFQRTARLRSPPQGLDLCVALGSAWARARVGEAVGEAVDAARPAFEGHSLYAQYLDCLAALLDEPEPDVPALFRGEPWHIKSCQTALGGWAQLRHTWVLQAKRAVFTLGMTSTEPGFVEPEPEFFARLRRLVHRTRGLLVEAGAFDLVHDRRELAGLLHAAGKALAEVGDLRRREAWKGREDGLLGLQVLQAIAAHRDLDHEWKDPEPLRNLLSELLLTLEDEERPLGDLREIVEGVRFDQRLRWERLERLCASLEAIAHKQLRGVAFSEWERAVISEYGEEIAWLMFYEGNTFSDPHDDAMRITEVFFDPRRGERLHVGVGRPRPLWILYPWQGESVLCIGAVMTYYEFESDSPLTDAQWRDLLDSEAPPPQPAWAESLRGMPGRKRR